MSPHSRARSPQSRSCRARAQTYDPDYPVCMQIYGRVSYFDCRYASLEQCRFSAAGRSASCVVNPYFARKKPAPLAARGGSIEGSMPLAAATASGTRDCH
ncbi:DUF3551 domain-containing protein [Bradyrhizobium ganzhouense]|uniref:DUF3551 domain-containing protein n=1 Tax=Bradyrhizobium ganzhouense TaxID=1179767 RepID=UPI003CEBD808